MTKRVASNQMTKENWMNEDEHEEAGQFEQAPTTKLQNREIKKARRRCEKNGVPSSPFNQFAGFVGANKAPFGTFSFQTDSSTSNGKNSTQAAKPSADNSFSNSGDLRQAKPTNSSVGTSELSKVKFGSEKKNSSDTQLDYFEKLCQLNTSFFTWVEEHMNKNKYFDFTPVCMDYIEHMKKLEQSASVSSGKSIASDSMKLLNFPSQPVSDLPGKFPSPDNKSNQSSQPKPAVSFSFLTKKDDQNVAPSPVKPFSFSSAAPPKADTTGNTEADDEDNYVPPKNDFQLVKEDNALYSKRCKLFYKKEGNYMDKGVGTLYLKEDDGKVQLIVRADTSTGLILLNICLSSSLPIQRVGKNNVLIVCIPNPPLDIKKEPESTPFLFRVKTSQDADDLLENLKKHATDLQ